MRLVVLVMIWLLPLAASAQEAIPEPDVIYAGRITSLPAGAVVEIANEQGVLASDSPAGSVVVIRVPLIKPVGAVPAGKATTGMETRLIVNGVAQRILTIGERGTIYTWGNPLPFSPTEPAQIPELATDPCVNGACVPAEPCGDGPPCGPGNVCVAGTCVTPTPTSTRTSTPTYTTRVTPTTPRSTPTPTGTRPTPSSTPTPTPTPTRTPTGPFTPPTPTSTADDETCAGDCDNSGNVAVNELVTGVNIALDEKSVDDCPSFDVSANRLVEVNELVSAVNNLLHGCDHP